MKDNFSDSADSPMAPAQECFAISPSDTDDLPTATKAIYVGESGDINILSVRSEQPTLFRNAPEGGILDVRARKILSTGTTAASLVGLA